MIMQEKIQESKYETLKVSTGRLNSKSNAKHRKPIVKLGKSYEDILSLNISV